MATQTVFASAIREVQRQAEVSRKGTGEAMQTKAILHSHMEDRALRTGDGRKTPGNKDISS